MTMTHDLSKISRGEIRQRACTLFIIMEDAGLEIPIGLTIASPFSWQMAIGNAGPTSALKSMGAKPTFRCHILNIGPSYKQ